METYTNIYPELCSYENLKLAFRKCRKGKTLKDYVIDFEADLDNNLETLKYELETFIYLPSPMKIFIIRDPKTRKIGASNFRDRVVYHAICNIIVPIFEKQFIYDSFANQINKGTHKAIKRVEFFMRKIRKPKSVVAGEVGISKKHTKEQNSAVFAFKADVRHYFDTVDHEILLKILERRIKDPEVMWLIRLILVNHKSNVKGKGMPLGNLTSQFFANVYLNELDQFVKHELKVKYYIRYVDDFVILQDDKILLQTWRTQIEYFLRYKLKLELHPEKSKIISINRGITLLGFRIFHNHKLLKKSNSKRIWKRLNAFKQKRSEGTISQKQIERSISGWMVYASFANTYRLRKRVSLKAQRIISD
jgi:RNA-directed DNA polymerase